MPVPLRRAGGIGAVAVPVRGVGCAGFESGERLRHIGCRPREGRGLCPLFRADACGNPFVAVPVRGVGCAASCSVSWTRPLRCRPREGRGLCQVVIFTDFRESALPSPCGAWAVPTAAYGSAKDAFVAVPVRGVGCALLVRGHQIIPYSVAVPVRGVGCAKMET